jgi:hypothetical protein
MFFCFYIPKATGNAWSSHESQESKLSCTSADAKRSELLIADETGGKFLTGAPPVECNAVEASTN